MGRARRVAELVALRLALPSRLAREPLDALLDSLPPSPARSTTSARSAWSLGRDVTRAELAVRLVPWIAGKCLYRALARYAVLRRTGMDATFVMGLGPRGVDDDGHAWVEVAWQTVRRTERREPIRRHVPLSASLHHGWQSGAALSNAPELGTLELHPKCLLTELEDGTGVVLNLETKFYHTLNSTAVALWKALEQGVRSDTELATKLVSAFEVDEAQALADVAVALLEFEHEGFLLRRGAR